MHKSKCSQQSDIKRAAVLEAMWCCPNRLPMRLEQVNLNQLCALIFLKVEHFDHMLYWWNRENKVQHMSTCCAEGTQGFKINPQHSCQHLSQCLCKCYRSNAVRQTIRWPFPPAPRHELWLLRLHQATHHQTPQPSASSCHLECSVAGLALLSSGPHWSTWRNKWKL